MEAKEARHMIASFRKLNKHSAVWTLLPPVLAGMMEELLICLASLTTVQRNPIYELLTVLTRQALACSARAHSLVIENLGVRR